MLFCNSKELLFLYSSDTILSSSVIAIDYGTKNIGIAIKTSDNCIAFPLSIIHNTDAILSEIISIIEKNKVSFVIVGDPINSGGKVEQDAVKLAQNISNYCNVLLYDERFSTSGTDTMINFLLNNQNNVSLTGRKKTHKRSRRDMFSLNSHKNNSVVKKTIKAYTHQKDKFVAQFMLQEFLDNILHSNHSHI